MRLRSTHHGMCIHLNGLVCQSGTRWARSSCLESFDCWRGPDPLALVPMTVLRGIERKASTSRLRWPCSGNLGGLLLATAVWCMIVVCGFRHHFAPWTKLPTVTELPDFLCLGCLGHGGNARRIMLFELSLFKDHACQSLMLHFVYLP
jgi:hypothetical protein